MFPKKGPPKKSNAKMMWSFHGTWRVLGLVRVRVRVRGRARARVIVRSYEEENPWDLSQG